MDMFLIELLRFQAQVSHFKIESWLGTKMYIADFIIFQFLKKKLLGFVGLKQT